MLARMGSQGRKKQQQVEIVLDFLIVTASVVFSYISFIGAGFVGTRSVLMPWILLIPAFGAGAAILRRRWLALAVHGAVIALNLLLSFLLFPR